MTSRSGDALSPPSWGPARRLHLGGPAIVALWILLWALFLGTVGAPAGAPPGTAAPVAAARGGAR
jgi:hypothetical protein